MLSDGGRETLISFPEAGNFVGLSIVNNFILDYF